MSDETVAQRLEAIRASIRRESVSWGELAELQGLAAHIDVGDVELLQWAGVSEFADAPCTCDRWFFLADADEDRDDESHEHRDAGDGCTALGCPCEHNVEVAE